MSCTESDAHEQSRPISLPEASLEVFLRKNKMKKACRKLFLRQALHVGATGFEPSIS
jgi:hypothetical protein